MSSKNSSLAVFCVTGLVVGIGLVVAPWFIEALPKPSKLVLAVSGAVLTGLFGILVVITRLYIKASADEAFLRTGVGGRECVIDGGALVITAVNIFEKQRNLLWANDLKQVITCCHYNYILLHMFFLYREC